MYKHGNQFWYQRAVPVKIQKILGKTSIKISLKQIRFQLQFKDLNYKPLNIKMFRDIIKK